MARRIVLFLVTLLALTLPAASFAQSKPVATASAAKAHVAGEPLFVEWGGSWWTASVITPLADGRTVIHYTGWGEDYDEVAKPKRIRTELANLPTPTVGESVFVEWQGSWWPGKVLKVASKNSGGYRIHYDGYGPEWDEDVVPARLTRLSPPEG